jgi:DHA2 family metal-tetracycline-proton antiporter-like MFS transporter
MSAGLIGSPGLGYAKDRFAVEELAKTNPALVEQYKAPKPSKFLFFNEVPALDGTRLAEAQKLEPSKRAPEQQAVVDASIAGDRRTLEADAFIPGAMAAIYLFLLVYFKTIGGYKPVHIIPVGEQQAKQAT